MHFFNHKTEQSFFRITWFVLLFYKWCKDLPKVIIHIQGDLTHGWMLSMLQQPASPAALVGFPSSFIKEGRSPRPPVVAPSEPGQWGRPCETPNSHQFHSLLLISLLASSFLLGTNMYNHGNKSGGPLGLKMTEAQTVVQEWESEHTQHLGRLLLCPGSGVTLPADTTLTQIRVFLLPRFGCVLAWVCMYLSAQA